MHSETMTPPTQLPYDLGRTLLEFAAEVDRPMALKLILVSHEVKRWIEPILYRHIKLNSTEQANAFIRTLDALHPKNPSLFSNTIKSISFTYGVTFHQAAKILSTCTNITSLSTRIQLSTHTLDISLDDVQNFASFMTTSAPALKRLSVTLQPFFLCPDPNFRVPIFQNLTHLSVFGSSCHRWSWLGLDTLEHLTHFALEIDTSTPLQVINNLIPHFPSLLRFCLVLISNGEIPLGEYLMDNREVERLISGDIDDRIAVGTTEPQEVLDAIKTASARAMILVSRWEDTFGDRIAWERARVVINRRRKRYISEIN